MPVCSLWPLRVPRCCPQVALPAQRIRGRPCPSRIPVVFCGTSVQTCSSCRGPHLPVPPPPPPLPPLPPPPFALAGAKRADPERPRGRLGPGNVGPSGTPVPPQVPYAVRCVCMHTARWVKLKNAQVAFLFRPYMVVVFSHACVRGHGMKLLSVHVWLATLAAYAPEHTRPPRATHVGGGFFAAHAQTIRRP